MKKIICLLILNGWLSVTVCCQVPAASIPAFSFSRLDHSPFTRESLAKDKLIFFIFFDTECDHCRQAIQYLGQHTSELSEVNIYLITLENLSKASIFLNSYGNKLMKMKNVLLLQDNRSEFIARFGPKKYPALFLYSGSKKLLLYKDDPYFLPRFLDQIKTEAGR